MIPAPASLSTETLAADCKVKPQSIRVRLCRTGSYFGLKPVKLPNGRLLWPGNALELLLSSQQSADA